ncbi:hypothetical protein EVAR_47301_1 [Eumeta japonica]|uniref:Uncharacterized protein n=1 Tax=Eumeta variegata TaxID=151549 RepID=A0A4C1YLP3_EUMVA|nr:hypothetical protein EVAR_47301_1 [Eumeta japonica]
MGDENVYVTSKEAAPKNAASCFLAPCGKDPAAILRRIVTGDETWPVHVPLQGTGLLNCEVVEAIPHHAGPVRVGGGTKLVWRYVCEAIGRSVLCKLCGTKMNLFDREVHLTTRGARTKLKHWLNTYSSYVTNHYVYVLDSDGGPKRPCPNV